MGKTKYGLYIVGVGILFFSLALIVIAFAILSAMGLDLGGLLINLIIFIVIVLAICAIIVALAYFFKRD